MSEYSDLANVIKTLAVGAVDAKVPVAVCFGEVRSESPLKILVDQKLEIKGDQIVLARTVTDYDTDMTVDHLTEKRAGGHKCASYENHDHRYKGRKSFRVHHKLIAGDKVVLLRKQGGQQYIVLDRVVANDS